MAAEELVKEGSFPKKVVSGVRFVFLVVLALGLLFAASCGGTEDGKGGEAPVPEQSPAVGRPEVAGKQVVSREKLDPPEPAPDFNLTNYTGERVSLNSLRGKVVMISFIYTRCPEACPLLTSAYLRLQREFQEEVDRGDLALVFITTDPDYDTPARLEKYTQSRGGKWYFLTGEEPDCQEVWRRYGIYREITERLRDVIVYHSYKIFLIDRNGMIRYRYIGIWSASDLIPDVREVLLSS